MKTSIKELMILDRVFQHYLEYNDNDEKARDLYHKILSPIEFDIKEKKKLQVLQWLNEQAQDQYGEFGFSTCSEEDQVDIVYSLIMGIMSAQR